MRIQIAALAHDTVLRKKYLIKDIIGSGGFSITYLSERIEDGERVFVKELFNKDYMYRISPEKKVRFEKDGSFNRFEQDVSRFKHERDFMIRFHSFPEMLSLLDYFEENNTVYIVSEYLPGETLKEHISNNGPYPAETLFGLMRNVLSILSKIHKNGYVHGDISPDNIVMDKNGLYRLVDFGAVKEIGTNSSSNNQLRKKNYTPAEIFNRNYHVNLRSDIYSLCAVYYYSLTGIAPEDSFERLLIDEVLPLSKLVPSIDSNISRMIMKGITIDPEKRWESIKELQTIIEDFDSSEAEKKVQLEKEKKEKTKRRLFGGAVTLCLTLAIMFFVHYTHKEYFYFKGKEISTIVFYYSEQMDAKRINKLYEDIDRKMSILSGNKKYLLDKSNGFIKATVEKDAIPDGNISSILNKYFRYSYCLLGRIDTGNFITTAELTEDSFESITTTEDSIIITLNESMEDVLKAQIPNTQRVLLRFYLQESNMYTWDHQNTPQEILKYDIPIECDYDGRQIFVNAKDLGETQADKELFRDCLLYGKLPIKSFNYERSIIWEEKKETTWGKNQVNASDLSGEKVILDYINPAPDEAYDPKILMYDLEKNDIEYDDSVIPLKKRLDALGVSYACGWDENNEYELYFAFESDSIWEIEAPLLFEMLECDLLTSDGRLLSEVSTENPLSYADGTINVTLDSPLDELQNVHESNNDTIQLCLNHYPVFQAQIIETGKDWRFSVNEPIIKNTKRDTYNQNIEHFVDYINSISTSFLSGNYCYIGTMYLDSRNSVNWEKDKWSMYGCEISEVRRKIITLFPLEDIVVECSRINPSQVIISCNYSESIKDKFGHPFEIAAEILKSIDLTNEISEIYITVNDKKNFSILGSITQYQFVITRDEELGIYRLHWDIIYFKSENNIDQNAFRAIEQDNKNVAIDYLKSENIFSHYHISPAPGAE